MERGGYYFPGELEVYCGPMKCGKSAELFSRISKLPYGNVPFLFFKPETDSREGGIFSRAHERKMECVNIGVEKGREIANIVREKFDKGVVVIDEAQFFNNDIVKGVDCLIYEGYNIVVAGLDMDFRGEPFGPMPLLLAKANYVRKLSGVCEYDGCRGIGTRTQRLIDGNPASYNAPIVSIEGKGLREIYECRCVKHHFVPGKKV